MNNRIKGIEWVAAALMFAGLILRWIHVDDNAILLNLGFIAYGIIGVIRAIQAKYHKKFTIDTLRILLSITMILLAVGNLNGERNYTLLAANMVILAFITMRNDKLLKRHA